MESGEIVTAAEKDAPAATASQPNDDFAPLYEKITWRGEQAASAPIPDDIPVYPSATPISGSDSKKIFVFQWETGDPKKKVMDFFRASLPDHGWSIQQEEDYGSFTAIQSGRQIDVWIGQSPNKPVSIMVRASH